MVFNKCLNFYIKKNNNVDKSPSTTHEEKMNFVFANSSEDDAIYPLMVPEIADAQKGDKTLENLKEQANILLNWSTVSKFFARMANLNSSPL